ncbi:hypothetical protein [Amycolatopsis sp. CA-128772]|uniref:hypothetical protein n=1 Tax=Amycolatopsis sp. CA-128772 TaxID=2073159 RepID=UPI0011B051E3|nr:hypothetical protein [Amycolatopsis sp. CA-128772]
MSIRVLAGVALLAVATAGPTVEGAAGPGPRTRRVGPHGTDPSVQAAADAARPGDTVAIEAGGHAGDLATQGDGSPGHPIRFRGADRFAVRNTLRNNVFGDGPVGADHNFAGNPGFADPAHGGYHLVGAGERRRP